MSKLVDDNLDPIIAAALTEDPTDDEEELKLKKEALSIEDTNEESEEAENEQDKEPIEEKKQESEEEGDKSEEEPEDKKPEKEPEEHKSRKERRAERKAAFLESIKREEKEDANRKQLFQTDPNYQPLNYEQQEEFKADELVQDRTKYGQQELAKGAQLGEYYATQTHFWDTVELENKVLSHEPKYSFLFETLPDGTANPDFDENKAGDINEMYLQMVGFDQQKKTVGRTDISYEKFVRRYVENVEEWIEERIADTQKNIASQQSKTGIRPTGSAKKSLGQLRPGSISSMSDEDFEKNEGEIDRQINSMLGI